MAEYETKSKVTELEEEKGNNDTPCEKSLVATYHG